jgi:hypothetical protein
VQRDLAGVADGLGATLGRAAGTDDEIRLKGVLVAELTHEDGSAGP